MFAPLAAKPRGRLDARSVDPSPCRTTLGDKRDQAGERVSRGDRSGVPDIGRFGAAWDFSRVAIDRPERKPTPTPALLGQPAPIHAKPRAMATLRAAPSAPSPLPASARPSLLAGAGMQPRLRIGAPDDACEREADHVADAVLSTPTPSVQPSVGCVACNRGPSVHRTPSEHRDAGAAVEMAVNKFGPGRALEADVRAYFEPRFGQRLDAVRVHTGTHAARAAEAVAARAFTLSNHVVFGTGEYAPRSRHGRRLLAHELAHVIQQQSAGDALVQREMVFGSGYPRPFKSDRAEVACVLSSKCTWFPASIDYRKTAQQSGGGSGCATFKALLDHIEAAAPGSIDELGLIGHANSDAFGLAGRIVSDNVWFNNAGLINGDSLQREKGRIAGLRNRFAAGAKIILYGCDAGAGTPFLDAISNAFHVCVEGFSSEVTWCIQWHTPSRHIFSRGRTWFDPSGLLSPEDVGCARYHADIRTLTPDRESCVGVPKPPPKPTAPAAPAALRFGASVSGGGALSQEGWRAAVDLGAQYSLRSDRVIVIDPTVGAHLLYLPSGGHRLSHIAAAIAELGLRVQQPVQGLYVDVDLGAYAGVQIPTGPNAPGASPIGGFTGALGAGYHWERLSIGAQTRGLVGAGPGQLLILGSGTFYW